MNSNVNETLRNTNEVTERREKTGEKREKNKSAINTFDWRKRKK